MPLIEGTIRRTARKPWRCEARDDTVPPERSPHCLRTIFPEDTYYEYVGETPAYQSGKRYCQVCANHALKVRRS